MSGGEREPDQRAGAGEGVCPLELREGVRGG